MDLSKERTNLTRNAEIGGLHGMEVKKSQSVPGMIKFRVSKLLHSMRILTWQLFSY
jgi:hypothetical protein